MLKTLIMTKLVQIDKKIYILKAPHLVFVLFMHSLYLFLSMENKQCVGRKHNLQLKENIV